MSKRPCASRAEWRFELGKPAKQLSPHYRLDCDHGTAIMVCREQGGSEPVYLCASHAEELKRRSEKRAEARRSAVADDSGCGSAKPKAEAASNEKPKASTGESPKITGAAENTKPTVGASPIVVPATPASVASSTAEPINIEEPVAKPAQTDVDSSKQSSAEAASMAPAAPAANSVARANPEEPASGEVRLAEKEVPRSIPAAKAARTTKELPNRSQTRDVAFGNPTKAIVDEAIWNLPTGDYEVFRTALQNGKPAAEAAQAAGGLLAAVHRRVTEYSLKLDAVLAASAKTISVQHTIDTPLEQAMVEIIESDSMTDSEKDAVIQQLGALQEWAKCGVRAQLTAFEANRGLLAIGERMNWGGPNEIPEQLKPAYRALFASLKKSIHASVPDAQELHERIVNLHAAKSDLLAAPALELSPR